MRQNFRYIIAWVLAVSLVLHTLTFASPAQATPLFSHSEIVLAETVNTNGVKTLFFSDTNQFYQELTEALRSKEAIQISTRYKSYDDFPPKLKEIIEIDKSQLEKFDKQNYSSPLAVGAMPMGSTAGIAAPMGSTAGIAPAPPREIPAKINYKPLIIIGSIALGAGAGAGIGTFFGGIGAVPGAIGGAIFGLVSGVVSEAFMSSDHRATIILGPDASIIITIEPF